VSPPRFTAEQRAAIEDRAGPALLAASAGSGKTAVMVERLVEAVRVDGVAVGAILALTFTEKAAGELRERVRRRLLELGEAEHARAVDGAWIGTIHGFCARVLRSRPLAAGLDPRFEVLDEPAARRLAEQAYERALDAWAAALGAPAVDLAAAYGAGLRELVLGAHDTLRSRGEARPRLAIPAERPAPDPAPLAAAAAEALRSLAGAGDGKRVSEGRTALEACARLVGGAPGAVPPPAAGGAPGSVPPPDALDAAKLGAGAKALGEPACEAYREAWGAYRAACADHHARAALVLLDDLLGRFGAAYADAKAARAGLDFEDLELGVRELLGDAAERARWAERFALIMVDEFQDTNRLQLELLEALERDTQPPSAPGTGNLFAVGDEFQSIYRFRHADVTIFRERAARLGAGRVRGLTANFRSAEELLDVLNGAFAPELGPGFRPLVAGGPREPAAGELRLFDPDPPAGEPPVELLVTDSQGWEDHDRALGLAGLGAQPWRRAEARLVAHRLREEVDAGRRPGDVVVLVRATASLRLFEDCPRTSSAAAATGPRSRSATGSPTWPRSRTPATSTRSTASSRHRSAARAPTPWCCSPPPAARAAAGRGRRWRRPRAARRQPSRRPTAPRAARPQPGWRPTAPRAPPRPPGSPPSPPASVRGSSGSRSSSRPSGRGASGSRSRCCSSGPSSRPATTSRSSRVPAASGGSPTCAS
jgi:hypothetical protein